MNKVSLKTNKVFFAKETPRVQQLAEKIGIVVPSVHTALFQAIYTPIEDANSNGVRLSQKAVDEALPKMIGAQSNINHFGKGFVVGIILDAWINETKEVEIIFTFAKEVYEQEYHQALEAMAEGKLTVSFELLSETQTQEKLADGTVLLNDIDFTGVGVLIGKNPGYKNAKVYEMATLYRDKAKNSEKELMFASQIMESCEKVLSEVNDIEKQGGSKTMELTEDQKKIVSDRRTELEGFLSEEVKDEDLLDDVKYAEFQKNKADATESKEEETAEEEKEEALQRNRVVHVETQETEADGKSVLVEQTTVVDVIDWEAKVKEAVAKVADLEKTVEEQKAEIETFKAEETKREEAERKAAIDEVKASLKDNVYAKDFSDEDYLNTEKVEKAQLLKERDDLKAEVEASRKSDVKKEEVNAEDQNDLPTGHVEDQPQLNPRKIIAKIGKK